MVKKTTSERCQVCPDCDWVVAVAPERGRRPVEPIACPRCGHVLSTGRSVPPSQVIALSLTALILLMVSIYLPFVGYDARGISQTMTLLDTGLELLHFHERLLAILVLFTVVVVPFLYLVAVHWIFLRLTSKHRLGAVSLYIVRTVVQLRAWMMADVFLLGALVSLIKISSLAAVDLMAGFYTFVAFVISLLLVADRVGRFHLWQYLPHAQAPSATLEQSAAAQGLLGCVCCAAPNHYNHQRCWRCGETLALARWRGWKLTLALLIAAAALLVPAHVLPVMETVNLGRSLPTSIIGGVVELWQSGDIPIAVIVFVASLVIPVAKILVLLVLLWLAERPSPKAVQHRLWLFKVTDWIGRWSMVDIFVVAVLVALVRSGQLMSVYPGNAALAFAATVILTMLAAMSFNTKQFFNDHTKGIE